MQLTDEQVRSFREVGYLVLDEVLPLEQAVGLRDALPSLFAEPRPSRILEKDGQTVRSIYAPHHHDERYAALTSHPSLVRAARALLGSDVYVYQVKVNAKSSFAGDVWEWHQDYIYWEREDGLPRPDVINFAVFLDDVTEFNGPITVVPTTHRLGTIDPHQPEWPATQDRRQPYLDKPEWIENLVAKLKYSVDNATLKELVDRCGLAAPKGKAGSVLVFHSKLIHGSAPNISPYERRIAMVTYSRADNVPPAPGSKRPDFLCARDTAPIKASDE